MLGSARLQYRQCAQNPPTAETHRQTLNAENHGERERSCARSRAFPFEKRANMPRFCAATAQQKKLAGAARGLGASCRRAALGCSLQWCLRFDTQKIPDTCFLRVSPKLSIRWRAIFLRAGGHLATHSAPATSLRQQATRPLPPSARSTDPKPLPPSPLEDFRN